MPVSVNNFVSGVDLFTRTSNNAGKSFGGSTDSRVVGIGDSWHARSITLSGSPILNGNTPINWLCALTKQALNMPFGCSTSYTSGPADIINYCVAVSGVTTVDVLAQQVPQARNLPAGWWSVLAGTNDLVLLPADSVDAITTRIQNIVLAGINNGCKVILWTLPPRFDSAGAGNWQSFASTITAAGSTVANQRQKHYAINNWIRTFAATNANIVLVDLFNILVDSQSSLGEPLAGLYADGIHCNNRGAFIAGMYASQKVLPSLTSVDYTNNTITETLSTINNTGNFVNGSAFNGTAGAVTGGVGLSGTISDSWTVDIQTGTLSPGACAVVSQNRTDVVTPGIISNGREVQFTVSGAVPGSCQIRAYTPVSQAIPANQVFFIDTEFLVTANTSPWNGPSQQIFYNSGAVSSLAFQPDGSSLPNNTTFSCVIRSPYMRHNAAASGLTMNQLNLTTNSAFVAKITKTSGRIV